MFLLPLLVVVALGLTVWVLTGRRRRAGAAGSPPTRGEAYLPTSTPGWLGTVALALALRMVIAVDLVRLPLLQGSLVLAASVLTAIARFSSGDRSAVVLIAFVTATTAAVAAGLFLGGELLLGHD